MRYRKRPVVIDACRVDNALYSAEHDWESMVPWLADAYEEGTVLFRPGAVDITTLEGTMTGVRGDWIIRGVQGELYPCKADIFEATYERVE